MSDVNVCGGGVAEEWGDGGEKQRGDGRMLNKTVGKKSRLWLMECFLK